MCLQLPSPVNQVFPQCIVVVYLAVGNYLFAVREGQDLHVHGAHLLIACNPFKKLSIYSDEQMAAYAGKPLGAMEPHVFAVADRAFQSMRHYGQIHPS